MGIFKKLFSLPALIIVLLIALSALASALEPQIIVKVVTEKNNFMSGYYNVKQSGNRVFEWRSQISNVGPGDMHVVTVAFHDDKAGNEPTTAHPASGFFSSGKTDYNEGEFGSMTSTFDTGNYNCGRVQLDLGFIDERYSDYHDTNFFAFIIDYGDDCSGVDGGGGSVNRAPTISSCNPASSSVTLGSAATINYAVSDPDGDSFAVRVDWGDGTSSTGDSSSASHTYSRAGSFIVTITATDSKGAMTSGSCRIITVTSQASSNNFPYGWLDPITPDGTISGWAIDKDHPSDSIDVHIYFDKPAGSGTAIGVNANIFRKDVNDAERVAGNHGYSFRIPDNLRDGSEHTVWVYGIDRDDLSGNSNRQLFGVPKKFTLGTIFVNSFEEGTNKPIVADFQILRDGQAIFKDQHSAGIEYQNQPAGTYELQVFAPASTSAYEYPPRFDQAGSRTLPSGSKRIGWNIYWKLKTATPANNPPVISSCNPRKSSIQVGERVTIDYHVTDPENDPFSVKIDWGDGETSTTSTPTEASHTYSKTGTFQVKITATDSKGAQSQQAPCGPITVTASGSGGNMPPIISSCKPPSSSVTLGSAATINYAVSDPDGDSFAVKIDWGDGTSSTGDSSSASHVYSSAGTFRITITATDSKDLSASRSCDTITITSTASANNPPFISFCNPAGTIVKLGSAATVRYSVSDPEGDAFTVKIDWGDGTSSTGGSNSASHVYSSTGTFSITITAKDSKGASSSRNCGTITITSSTLTNNPPIISSCSPASPTVNFGDTAFILYSISDPDGDSVDVLVNWGDGSITKGGSSSASHVYTSTGTFSVSIKAVDSKGSVTQKVCNAITVVSSPPNNPPVISFCSPSGSSVNLGSAATVNYDVSDPDGDSFAVKIDWGDGTSSTGGSNSASHVYSSTGTFSITIIATDSKGTSTSKGCGSVTVTAVSTNSPPSISSCSPPPSITVGSTATMPYSISDPDGDSFTVTINWGDGSASTGGTSSASHTYSSAGTFSITITATDSKGASSSKNCGTITVTGGGSTPSLTSTGAKLKITSVDTKVDGKSSNGLHDGDKISKKAKPLSKVEIRPKVKNLFNSTNGLKIRDIKIKTTIEGVDNGDDLEDESNEFDLRPQDDKSVTARFNLPLNVEEGTYTVSIEAEGEDTDGNEHSDSVNIDLEVKKEKHDLRFIKLDLSKLKINCNETFNANYQIINLGQEDEKRAYVEIKSDELGIDFTQKDIQVKSGTTANTYTKSQSLKLSNRVEDGSYTITGNVFTDNGKLTDTMAAQLIVQNCGREEKASVEKTPTFAASTTQITGTQTTKTVYQIPFIDIFRSGTNFGLLIITTFILSIFFLIVACVLLARDEYEE